MAIHHSITGYVLPQTRTADQVVADMETAVRSILSFSVPPPCPERLIAQGQLRYAYEPSGQDHYLGWWQWPLASLTQWNQARELLWENQALSDAPRRGLATLAAGLCAIDDCDGMSTHAVAWHRTQGRRAWPLCQEFRVEGQVKGWHALALLELPIDRRHPAEIPTQPLTYLMDRPWPAHARPGHRLVTVDLSWMGGMPRVKEGRFDLESLKAH